MAKMTKCKTCGAEIAKNAKVCVACGAKNKQSLLKKWWVWAIVIVFLIAIGTSDEEETMVNEPNPTVATETQASESTEEAPAPVPEITEEEYKGMCNNANYKDISRNPTNYEGSYLTFKGKVIQTQESGNSVILRVNVTRGEYDIWEDTIYVEYERASLDEPRILEDDIISVYGLSKGIKTYKSVMGSAISIPWLSAEYIDIH